MYPCWKKGIESVTGFLSECLAGFVGIRTLQ